MKKELKFQAKTKKIIFLGRFSPPVHGAARMNELYLKVLKKNKKFEVKKIKINKYNSLEKIGRVDISKIVGYFQVVKELVSNIVNFNPEIIYLEMAPKGVAFFKDSIFVLISKMFHKKIFIQFHAKGAKETTKNKVAEKYYKFIFKNTKIILLSKILFDDVKNVAKWSQVEILPNGIPDEITDKEFKKIITKRKKNKKPVFLFLSNMIESKGPLDVLKICNELDKKEVDFRCNFIGNSQDKEFEARFMDKLKEYKLGKKCKYLGPKYGKDRNKFLEKTDFMIFPTKYPQETFGLVILEAFMYGIPTFSYKNASIPEIISKDFLGHVSNEDDWSELAEHIKKRIKRKSDSIRIRKYFKRHYTINKSSNKISKIIS